MAMLLTACSEVRMTAKETELGSLGVCGGISCDLNPLTTKPAVTTILIALGDEADNQLVVNGASAQLIAETVIRYSTPKANPKILVVQDSNAIGEDPEDTAYTLNVLLGRYRPDFFEERADRGITDADLAGYDLVWLNNPGRPMGKASTREALLRFKGGVVIQGDDLADGNEELTGLRFVDNGTQVTCDGVKYAHDNNAANRYQIALDPSKVPGANSSEIAFEYGNDIDNTQVARSDLEVLASARGGHSTCSELRPAIVRYLKN
jgi:hypothetical protein